MNFFFRKKDDAKSDSVDTRYCITMSGRAYNKYDDRNASLKIWLPTSIEKTLNEVCTCVDTTKSDFIRQIIFVHMYGRADFLALVKIKHPCIFDQADGSGIRFSIAGGGPPSKQFKEPPPVVKNDIGLKLWLPQLMKDDLERLAIKSKTTMSSYAREVIASHLLGDLPYDNSSINECPPKEFTED